MKKTFVTALAVIFIFSTVGIALALDSMVTAPISKVDTMIDKNGAEYVRVVITEDRALNGVKYQTEVLVMAFGGQVEGAKALKAGDTLKAICNGREYKGKLSYTALKILR